MPTRSRRAVVAWTTVGYALVWVGAAGLAFAAAFATNTDNPDGSDSWAAIGMGLLGFALGLLVGHVAWMWLVVRMLTPFGRTWRTVTTVLGAPASVVLATVVINERGVHWGLWPLAALCAPAALSWWASAPGRRR